MFRFDTSVFPTNWRLAKGLERHHDWGASVRCPLMMVFRQSTHPTTSSPETCLVCRFERAVCTRTARHHTYTAHTITDNTRHDPDKTKSGNEHPRVERAEEDHRKKSLWSFVSPKLTRPTLFYVHCVPREGGLMQGWESVC